MKTHTTTQALQFTAMLITGLFLFEPLKTAFLLLALGVGLLIYVVAVGKRTGN